jgi:hypothetical protein
MKTICLNTVKTLLVTILLLAINVKDSNAQNESKPKLNRLGLGLRLSHLYDIKFDGFGNKTGIKPEKLNNNNNIVDEDDCLNNYLFSKLNYKNLKVHITKSKNT